MCVRAHVFSPSCVPGLLALGDTSVCRHGGRPLTGNSTSMPPLNRCPPLPANAGPQTCRCESQSSTAGDMQPGVRPSTRRAANSCLVWGLGLDLFLFPPVLRLEPGTLDILGFPFCCHFLFVPPGTCPFRSQVSRVLVMTLMLAQERDPLAKCSLGPLHTEHSAT